MNSFLFLRRFSVSLKIPNNYFFGRFAYKPLLNRFSVLMNYIMWFSNHFSTSSCLPHFSGSRFFRVQVFQGPGFPGSWSRFFRVRVQVLKVALTFNRFSLVWLKNFEFQIKLVWFATWNFKFRLTSENEVFAFRKYYRKIILRVTCSKYLQNI